MWNTLIQSVDRYVRIVVNYIDDVDDFVDFDGEFVCIYCMLQYKLILVNFCLVLRFYSYVSKVFMIFI